MHFSADRLRPIRGRDDILWDRGTMIEERPITVTLFGRASVLTRERGWPARPARIETALRPVASLAIPLRFSLPTGARSGRAAPSTDELDATLEDWLAGPALLSRHVGVDTGRLDDCLDALAPVATLARAALTAAGHPQATVAVEVQSDACFYRLVATRLDGTRLAVDGSLHDAASWITRRFGLHGHEFESDRPLLEHAPTLVPLVPAPIDPDLALARLYEEALADARDAELDWRKTQLSRQINPAHWHAIAHPAQPIDHPVPGMDAVLREISSEECHILMRGRMLTPDPAGGPLLWEERLCPVLRCHPPTRPQPARTRTRGHSSRRVRGRRWQTETGSTAPLDLERIARVLLPPILSDGHPAEQLLGDLVAYLAQLAPGPWMLDLYGGDTLGDTRLDFDIVRATTPFGWSIDTAFQSIVRSIIDRLPLACDFGYYHDGLAQPCIRGLKIGSRPLSGHEKLEIAERIDAAARKLGRKVRTELNDFLALVRSRAEGRNDGGTEAA